MTDEAKALVERLRDDLPQTLIEKHWVDDNNAIYKQREEAADLIETQAREIERLRERLEIDPAHSIDGIYARDETIRGLDAELAKFKALAETLAEALEPFAEEWDEREFLAQRHWSFYREASKAIAEYKEASNAS